VDILKGILYGFIAQVITFIQLQGQMKYDWVKNHPILVAVIGGAPISLLFMASVKHFIIAYNGEIWPSRLIGFAVGIITFALMSYFLFKEPITLKTLVCLGLGTLIILVQIFWK
jgi:multidrug transporter EmrE-like cation transporter